MSFSLQTPSFDLHMQFGGVMLPIISLKFWKTCLLHINPDIRSPGLFDIIFERASSTMNSALSLLYFSISPLKLVLQDIDLLRWECLELSETF